MPAVPVALQSLWGSCFSRIEGGRAMLRPLRRSLFSPVGLAVGPALAPERVTPELLRSRVLALAAA